MKSGEGADSTCPRGPGFWIRLVLSVSALTLAAGYLPAVSIVLHQGAEMHPARAALTALGAALAAASKGIFLWAIASVIQGGWRWATRRALPACLGWLCGRSREHIKS